MQTVEIHNWDVQFDVNGNPVYCKFSVSGIYLTIPLVLNLPPVGTPTFQYVVVDGDYTGFCGYSNL